MGTKVTSANLHLTPPAMLDATHALIPGALTEFGDQGLVLVTLGAAPQLLPPPSGFSIGDLTVSHDGTTAVVSMGPQNVIGSDLWATTDFQHYTQLTHDGHSRGPLF